MEWLRVQPQNRNRSQSAPSKSGVDREAGVIRGVVLAEVGQFKDLRGQFSRKSLQAIVEAGNARPGGLKSRLGHPTLSDDGIGKHLGRIKDLRVEDHRVLGDMYFDPTAFKTPNGDLATYTMDLVDSDPEAINLSLVVDSGSLAKVEVEGEPDIWIPEQLHAADVVDTGAATSSFLSADGLPDQYVRKGCELLDSAFEGLSSDEVRRRAESWLAKYLSYRFGKEEDLTMSDTQTAPIVDPEVIATPVPPQAPEPATAPAATAQLSSVAPASKEAVELDRYNKIHALCKLYGCEQRAGEFFTQPLSVENISQYLAAELTSSQSLGALPNGAPAPEPKPKTQEELWTDEYKQNEQLHAEFGVTLEDYIRTARINARGGVVHGHNG